VRRSINDRYVLRGAILSHDGTPLSISRGEPGNYQRYYDYPDLGPILGYTDPIYGQAGLEASLDETLRGLQGNSQVAVWWNHLVYGQPPPGLDIRLSLNLSLQRRADELLGDHAGALVLLNAESGEILAMASHPTFDANQLEAAWESLIADQGSPLFNRATLGLYPTGAVLGGQLLAAQVDPANLPAASSVNMRDCAMQPIEYEWGALVSAGCPSAVAALGERLRLEGVEGLFEMLGIYTAAELDIPTAASPMVQGWSEAGSAALGVPDPATDERLLVSPLQMALAAASLSNGGLRPAPRLAAAIDTPQSGWVILPPQTEPVSMFTSSSAQSASLMLAVPGMPAWQVTARAWDAEGKAYTWYLAGTQQNWPGAPLALAVVIEEDDAQGVSEIGTVLLQEAMQP
jgi:hypothetical protein